MKTRSIITVAVFVAAATAVLGFGTRKEQTLTATKSVISTSDERLFQSGPSQVQLLELYSSEGCSSCPPAEAWLGTLKNEPGLWKTFVPVAFHVDYWNHLGWADRFSRASFTARQQKYASLWNSSSVYTPGFVLNGREQSGWPINTSGLNMPGKDAAGSLDVRFTQSSGEVRIAYQPENKLDKSQWIAHIAWLGFELKSPVKAGENSGRLLEQNFVALALQDLDLTEEGAEALRQSVKTPDTSTLPDHAQPKGIAVWVTHGNDPTPVQATGGWLR